MEQFEDVIHVNDDFKEQMKFKRYERDKLKEKAGNFDREEEHYGIRKIEEILRLSKEQERMRKGYRDWHR